MDSTRPLGARQDRFTQLPDALISELTPREHQLVHALLSYRWADDALIFPSVRTLADQMRCSDRTIQRTLHQLAERGWIIIEARYRDDQGQTSNLYRPGPLLAPLLSPSGRHDDARQAPLWHPPVTRRADERYSGNQTNRTRRPGRPDIRIDRDYFATREGDLRVRA